MHKQVHRRSQWVCKGKMCCLTQSYDCTCVLWLHETGLLPRTFREMAISLKSQLCICSWNWSFIKSCKVILECVFIALQDQPTVRGIVAGRMRNLLKLFRKFLEISGGMFLVQRFEGVRENFCVAIKRNHFCGGTWKRLQPNKVLFFPRGYVR